MRVTAADFCFSGGYTQGYGASAKIKNFSKKIFNVVVVGVNYIPASTPYKNFDLSFYSTSIGYIRLNISFYIHIGISIARTREG